jgi:glutathione S-transferase
VRLKFGREPDLPEALCWLFEGVADLYPWLKLINNKLEDVMSNQEELDARAARIEAANVAVDAAIADLKAQVAAGTAAAQLDFTRLDAAVAGEEALEPAPVVAPPAV